jgi:hypothetical protein
MYKSTLAVAALLSVASAQSTVSLYLPGFDPQSIDASVVGSVCDSDHLGYFTF